MCIDAHQFFETFFAYIQTVPIDIFIAWHPSQHRLYCACMSMNAIRHPLQYSHVLAKTRPHNSAGLIHAEPIHAKDSWCMINTKANLQPVIEIVTHVITTERQHSHGIATNLADFTYSSGSSF